ncbi:MAG: sigma factor-like helix-turn-helix DNA-binding protein [Agriterribacter sp.]
MTRYAVYHYMAKEKKVQVTSNEAEQEKLSTSDQEEVLNNKLLIEMIEKLSNTLPEKCRLVFVQNKLHDIALPQVARHLHISDKTAEAHLTKALKIIRGNFKKAFFFLFTI